MSDTKTKRKSPTEIRKAAEHLLAWSLQVAGHIPPNLMSMSRDRKITNYSNEFGKAIESLADALGIGLVHYNDGGCSWNPEKNERARAGDKHNAKVKAVVYLGSQGTPLCGSCSRSSYFSRMRKRVPITT